MEKKQTALAVGAILAIVGSLAFIYFTQFATPRVNVTPLESLGFAVAEETAKLLNGQGRVVVVGELVEVQKSPNLDAQIKGFKAGLAKLPGVTLKEVRELKRPPADDPRLWPPNLAGQIAVAAGGADALVWFGSLPQELNSADVTALKGIKSQLVVVSAQSPLLKPMLQQGLVKLAIVNRFPPKPAPSGKETPRQWFERSFLVASPTALGELP